MKEKLQGGLEKVKGFYAGEQKSKHIKITAVILVVVIAVSVIIALILNNRPYETLVTGLTSEEMSTIATKLEEYGATDYKIEGDTIKVPEAQVANLQAKLVVDGYPKSGFLYGTYLDNIGLMSSESDRETLKNYELQDRMAAVIRNFTGVKNAVVDITPGSDQRYVLDSDNATPASAAVFVEMSDGGALPENYVDAIGNFVAHSVQGLDFESVTITDSLGNSYTPGSQDTSTASASDLKLRLENQVNNRVRNEVLQALTPIYGSDNVRVSVTSTVDVSRRVQETTEYTTPEGAPDGEGIIGHREYDQELARGEDDEAGGAVGTTTNADIPTYMETEAAVNGNETYIKNSGTEDMNVNTTKEQAEMNSGVVTDVMIAVTINQDTAGNVGTAQLISHIARAAGISVDQQADKINVLVAPFYNPTTENIPSSILEGLQIPKWALYVAAGVLGLLLLLIVLLIIRAKKRKQAEALLLAQQEEEWAAEQAAAALEAEEQVDNVLEIKNEKSMELKQDIRKFTEENPEIAAQMIRTWLRGEGVNG